jgi:ribosomal-protein-alanine N-acetyltransferase
MGAIEEKSRTRLMPYSVRPLEERDIAQSAEIERDAFPSLFPPTSFRRELKNQMASYLVAWRLDGVEEEDAYSPPISDGPQQVNGRPLITRLFQNARSLLPRRPVGLEDGQQLIVGFLGVWYMVEEAHIVSIGVRREYRGRGIGELLLIAAIEQAMKRRARVATLEVRVSNSVARNLYKKYGFREQGVRKGYYTDNREDAIIMTTDPILVPPYPGEFAKLTREHERRWGRSERTVP